MVNLTLSGDLPCSVPLSSVSRAVLEGEDEDPLLSPDLGAQMSPKQLFAVSGEGIGEERREETGDASTIGTKTHAIRARSNAECD